MSSSTTRSQQSCGRLLTCVYQSTRNSGQRTLNAAANSGDGDRRRVPGMERRRAGRRVRGDRVATRSAASSTWEQRRRGAAEHPGPAPRARRLAAGQSARRAAADHEQPQRSGRRLRHDGRRHVRRPGADRRHRQGVPARLAEVDGNDRPGRHRPAAGAGGRQRPQPTAELRPPRPTRPTKPT